MIATFHSKKQLHSWTQNGIGLFYRQSNFLQESWVYMEAPHIHMPCSILAIFYHFSWSEWWFFTKLIMLLLIEIEINSTCVLESSMARVNMEVMVERLFPSFFTYVRTWTLISCVLQAHHSLMKQKNLEFVFSTWKPKQINK